MIDILRKPDDIRIYCDEERGDAVVTTEMVGRKLHVTLTAVNSHPRMICMRWNHRLTKPVQILGDKWERSYADMEWHSLSGEHFMPWYFLATDGCDTVGCGVMTQPNSYVCFQCDASGVTAWFDVRCGGVGVSLSGRSLLAGVIVCEHYSHMSPFAAAKAFCTVMCEHPCLPKESVYGSNNWYYAYGNSSFEEILIDARLVARLTAQNQNRPFMVIDDGWQLHPCAGPWRANERFGDMKKVADEFHAIGVKAGLWFRPLHDEQAEAEHPTWRILRNGERSFLDPSHPEVQAYLRTVIADIKSWGFELIKHDFSTHDLFGNFGGGLNGLITTHTDWSFYDTSKTSAEITLDLYRLIREAAGDMVVIGCNTVSHLCAGLVEVNRTGSDTSGRSWNRTRALGVNTLAFRMCQNNAFYKVDADCVGILEDHIDWALNRQWLDLLAKSGSPLFVSMQPSSVKPEMEKDLIEAFAINAVQTDTAEPLDWMYNKQPQRWCINGDTVEYDFIQGEYPALIHGQEPPFFNERNF